MPEITMGTFLACQRRFLRHPGPFPEPSPAGDHRHVSVHPGSVTQALTYPFLASSMQNKTGYWNSPVQGQVGLLLALGEGKGYLFSLVLGHTVEKAH